MLAAMSVNLSFDFESELPATAPYGAAQLDNPFFRILAAIRDEGSIGRAADRLGLSYRHVWGFLKKQEAAFGRELLAGAPGQAARLSELGERLVRAEQRMLARHLPAAEALAAKLDTEILLALEPDLRRVAFCASHDLLFGALRDRVRRAGRVLLDLDVHDGAVALERLNLGACLLAGVHLPVDEADLGRRGAPVHAAIGRHLRLGEHKLIRFANREQGLIVAAGNPLNIRSIADLRREDLRFINRPTASGTRLLIDELLARERLAPAMIRGYDEEEGTHFAVAARIADGAADCGVGLRAAARRFALGYVPLLDETYFVVCRTPDLETSEVRAVIEILRSENFRKLAADLPGYDAADAGEIVSLRRTLPWYR